MRLSHIENRIEQQLSLSTLIFQLIERFNQIPPSDITVRLVNSRITTLKENWEKFTTIHDAIGIAIGHLTSEEKDMIRAHSYFIDDVHSQTYLLYLNSIDKMNAHMDSEELTIQTSSTQSLSQSASNQITVSHHTRLPRIDLPKFNGTSSEWMSFKDLFSSIIIGNAMLSPVEKLQYLKASLTGTAAHLLKNTALTADNFEKAWTDLVSFYENKRILVNSAMQALLSVKKIMKEDAKDLEHLYTTMMQIYRSFEILQRPVDKWDDFLVYLAVQKLDSDSVKVWEQHLGSSKEPPTWNHFCEFLLTRFLSLQAYEKSQNLTVKKKTPHHAVKSHHQAQRRNNTNHFVPTCVICSAKHFLTGCSQYNSQTTQQRHSSITKHGLCYNCLGKHHVSECRSTKRCTKCGKKHHTTLHRKNPSNAENTSERANKNHSKEASTKPSPLQVHHSSVPPGQTATPFILLATAQVLLINKNRQVMKIRALLDQGSEVTLISERAVQTLRLPRSKTSIPLVGIGENSSNRTRGSSSFKVISLYDKSEEIRISAHILNKLTSVIPSVSIIANSWSHIEGLSLADPQFNTPGSIDLIIGADIYPQIIKEGLRKGAYNAPIAQLTSFGWVISGPASSESPLHSAQSYHVSMDSQLYDLLQKFWQLEEISVKQDSCISPENQKCEEHFKKTHSRNAKGRYVVRLPFKKSPQLLGNSFNRATKVMESLRIKLHSNAQYSEAYLNFMKEYKDLQHMQILRDMKTELLHPNFYLPHHGVWRESSTTTKLRVVFNGSSRTTSGISLNEILYTGPKLQTDLFNVLIWFRQFRYVFSVDIEKMYRQINVHPDDWKYQRIRWLNSQESLQSYDLTTVTYGLACAPYLALRTISQLIEDEGKKYPLAVPCLEHGRYVDDIFGGADTIKGVQEIIQQLNHLCMAGGFPLQKWASNDQEILKNLTSNHKTSPHLLSTNQDSCVAILGLQWQPTLDNFQFVLDRSTTISITKRFILSTIAKLFDPLGFLSPVIIKAKVLIQNLWVNKLGWDEPLPVPIADTWISFVSDLEDLKSITIPRWIGAKPEFQIQLHGFCDASTQAFAAVIYIRVVNLNGKITTNLITSKTKVSPLKRLTIPRLELSGAVLLTKLMTHILQVLKYKGVSIYMWTDSSITLTWINNHPSKWKDFIQNRVVLIQEAFPEAKWKFVPGKENPSDIAIRGMSPSQLAMCTTWWKGPSWLSQTEESWPNHSFHVPASENLEKRPPKVCTTIIKKPSEWELLNRYSSLNKLLRITALCMRAIERFKRSKTKIHGPLTIQEIDAAKMFWIQKTQQTNFIQEIRLLSKGSFIPKSSSLHNLTPFLDAAGLLRTGGRLQNSLLSPESKHLLILPKHSILTQLIIADAHTKTCHGGTQLTLTYIRNSFWIISSKKAQQLIGQLPSTRVTPTTRPFVHTGVDYAGPLFIKTWKGKNARQYKAYIAVFVCFATSAVHLELVTDYSADTFIAAYKRFTARRGICVTLTSDCGTTLSGADAELKRLFFTASKEQEQLASLLTKDGTQWRFNPPSAPHFGGKWEAAVKSVKFHLKRIVGIHLLPYEEMTTLLTQIEAVLNSRPLCPLSDDPDDLSVLTPGHFFLGHPPTVLPEPSLEDVNASRLSRWQLLRQLLESFWSRWSKECLQRFHATSKWNNATPSLTKGTMVLVVDERYPPSKWPLGRIIETHPGKDGHIRVVTVRTQTTELKRPIVKLCPLPINSEVPDSSFTPVNEGGR